jgi:hypothetical protein
MAISHSMVADVFSRHTGRAVEIRQRLGPGKGVMACDWLESAGFTFGGWPLFEETVGRLIDACDQGGTK